MAAGLGFKTFTTGEVLTAADTNGYLMQGVLVFASSAARAAAITSPQEGQYSYLKDTNSTEYYDGAAWIAAPIGDITGVTAGTGISGGGTSGTVTITNSMATEITAAGDIIVGTGSGTFDNLPIGTTAQVLTADTTVSPYKVKWATPTSGGGLTVIESGSFSSTSTLISSIPTTYKQLILQINAWYLSSTGWGLYLRLNDDSGASRYYNNVAFATTGQTAFNATKLDLTMDNFGLTTSGYGSVTCTLPNYASTTAYKQANITGVGQGNSTNPSYFTFQANGGLYNQLTAITSLRITNGAGATQNGTYTLYGVS